MTVRLLHGIFATGWSQALLATRIATAFALAFGRNRPWLLALAASAHLIALAAGGLDAVRDGSLGMMARDPALKATLASQAYSQFQNVGLAAGLAALPAVGVALVVGARAVRLPPWRRPELSLAPVAMGTCAALAVASSAVAPAPGIDSWQVRALAYGAFAACALVARWADQGHERVRSSLAIAVAIAATEHFALSLHLVVTHGCYAVISPESRYFQLEIEARNATALWHMSALIVAAASSPALRDLLATPRRTGPALLVLAALAVATLSRHPGPVYAFLLTDWRSEGWRHD